MNETTHYTNPVAFPENAGYGCVDCGSINHTAGDASWCAIAEAAQEKERLMDAEPREVAALDELREFVEAGGRATTGEILSVFAELERSRTTEQELRDDLRIANERGDAWRETVKEDTVRLERVRALTDEYEDGVSPECSRFAERLREVLGDEQ